MNRKLRMCMAMVCVLVLMAGATYQEMVADYMLTYDNYYGINQTSEPTEYGIIKEKYVDVMLRYIAGTATWI